MVFAPPVPIELPPPPVPSTSDGWPEGIPGIDEPIRIIGRGAVETWNDIFDFVHNTWNQSGNVIDILPDVVTQVVFPVIEGYVGQAIKAVGSVIDDAVSYTSGGLHIIDHILENVWSAISDINDVFAGAVYALIGAVEVILDGWIPLLYDAILGVVPWVEGYVHDLAIDIETWAVGHILNPVLDELLQTEAAIRADVFSLVDAVAGSIMDAVGAIDADLLARLGLVAAVAAAALTFVEECGKDMCATFGPKTDIGKLFKALQAAELLLVLHELGDMDEAKAEQYLRDLAGRMGHIISVVDDVFVGGGGTLRDIAGALV